MSSSCGGAPRVLVEHLVEVAHAIEQEHVRMLRLDAQVLLHHRGMILKRGLESGISNGGLGAHPVHCPHPGRRPHAESSSGLAFDCGARFLDIRNRAVARCTMDNARIGLLYGLATRVGTRLLGQGRRVTTAESCTGGWIAKALTDIPGSSQWFGEGFVTYSNEAKVRRLGVSRVGSREQGRGQRGRGRRHGDRVPCVAAGADIVGGRHRHRGSRWCGAGQAGGNGVDLRGRSVEGAGSTIDHEAQAFSRRSRGGAAQDRGGGAARCCVRR